MMKVRENVHWQDYVKKIFFVKVFFLIKEHYSPSHKNIVYWNNILVFFPV